MNTDLISALIELQEIADILGDIYREKAYRKAILGLEKVKYKITPNTLEQLHEDKIPGIGSGIFNRIKEFVSTGKIVELENLQQSKEIRAFRELSKIMGVGPVTVKKWMGLKIYTLADLRRAIAAGSVILTDMQKLGLIYYQDLNERIPRAEVTLLGQIVLKNLKIIDPNIIFEITGSYRRGKQTSGDIDILISNKSNTNILSKLILLLQDDPNFINTISAGKERVTFLYKSPTGKVRQIDVLSVVYESYYAALLYFTGSWDFNEALRGLAKKNGYRLNQSGLYRTTRSNRGLVRLDLIPTMSEREIFDILKIPYVPPTQRDKKII